LFLKIPPALVAKLGFIFGVLTDGNVSLLDACILTLALYGSSLLRVSLIASIDPSVRDGLLLPNLPDLA
jgi:hypothetical protein